MGSLSKRKSGVYYYRAIRKSDGSWSKTYVGKNETARLAEKNDATSKIAEQSVAQKQHCLDTLLQMVFKLNGMTELVSRVAMLQAGYHLHSRGEWRLRNASRYSGH